MDAAQETWIRVFRALADFDASRSFRPWLFAIALNTARDEGRRQQRSPVNYDSDQPLDYDAERHAHDDHSAHDERQAIDRALLGVTEPYRTAIVLVDCEGFDYSEAAQCCGVALGTMKSRVARGRAAFRDEWQRICGSGPTQKRKTQS